MELKIVNKKEQPMLSRIEVTGTIDFNGATPSTAEVKKQLSAELKVGEELIVIKSIYTHFGKTHADLTAYSYLNKEDMKKIEPKPKKKEEKKGAEGAKPAEAPKAEKKEEAKKEAPKEEKKEEAPKEEKKE